MREPMPRAGQIAKPDPRIGQFESNLGALTARLDEMVARLHVLEGTASAVERSVSQVETQAGQSIAPSTPRRRGRPPKVRPQMMEEQGAVSVGKPAARMSPHSMPNGCAQWHGLPRPTRAATARAHCGAMRMMREYCRSAAKNWATTGIWSV